MSQYDDAIRMIAERFGRDSLISIATVEGTRPYVRIVNGYYEGGSFYIITEAVSQKVQQIESHAEVAICGDWFTAHGIGQNLGSVRHERNVEIMATLRKIFADWYSTAYANAYEPISCLLRIRLTDAICIDLEEKHGILKYVIDFSSHGT